jgi:hypothetical protein
LNDEELYINKNKNPIFECTVADIEKLPMTRLSEASAEEMGQRSISMQIFGRLEHEFEKDGFIIKLN